MANRNSKLIERTLKDFSLSISTNGGSDGDGYGIIKEACEFENKYRKKVKEALMAAVGSNAINARFSTIQDFLSFLKEIGLDENKKYININVNLARTQDRDSSLGFFISIDRDKQKIFFGTKNKYSYIPFYQGYSEEDSSFELIERSFTDEYSRNLYVENTDTAGEWMEWFRFYHGGNDLLDVAYSPFVACEYFNEEFDGNLVETYKLDYNILLKWMTLKPVYITPGR